MMHTALGVTWTAFLRASECDAPSELSDMLPILAGVRCVRHRCVVPQPLPIPLPFPSVFSGPHANGPVSRSHPIANGDPPGSSHIGSFQRQSRILHVLWPMHATHQHLVLSSCMASEPLRDVQERPARRMGRRQQCTPAAAMTLPACPS